MRQLPAHERLVRREPGGETGKGQEKGEREGKGRGKECLAGVDLSRQNTLPKSEGGVVTPHAVLLTKG